MIPHLGKSQIFTKTQVINIAKLIRSLNLTKAQKAHVAASFSDFFEHRVTSTYSKANFRSIATGELTPED